MSKHRQKTPAGPTQRQLRVGEQIRHVIAETLARGHFHEEALADAGAVTVTEVRVSPDLKHAHAYVLSLGGQNMDSILPALNNVAHLFQKEVNRGTQLKFTPKISFRRDDSFDTANHLETIIRGIEYAAPTPSHDHGDGPDHDTNDNTDKERD